MSYKVVRDAEITRDDRGLRCQAVDPGPTIKVFIPAQILESRRIGETEAELLDAIDAELERVPPPTQGADGRTWTISLSFVADPSS